MEVLRLAYIDSERRKMMLRGTATSFQVHFVDEVEDASCTADMQHGKVKGGSGGCGGAVDYAFSEDSDSNIKVAVARVAAVVGFRPVCPWTVHALMWMFRTRQPMMTPATVVRTLMTVRDDVPLICRNKFLFAMSMAVSFIAAGAYLPTFVRVSDKVICAESLRKVFLQRAERRAEAISCKRDTVACAAEERLLNRQIRNVSVAETIYYIRFRLFGALMMILYKQARGQLEPGNSSSSTASSAIPSAFYSWAAGGLPDNALQSQQLTGDALASGKDGGPFARAFKQDLTDTNVAQVFKVQTTGRDGQVCTGSTPVSVQVVSTTVCVDGASQTKSEIEQDNIDCQMITNVVIKDMQAMKALFPSLCTEERMADNLVIVMDVKCVRDGR
jgi:hypothetical protein